MLKDKWEDEKMVDITLEEITQKENMELALEHLEDKRDSCGPDGMPLSALRDYWKINGQRVRRSITDGEYRQGKDETQSMNQKE